MSAAPAAAASASKSKSKAHKSARKSVAADALAVTGAHASATVGAVSFGGAAASAAAAAAAASLSSPRFVHPLHRCRFLTFLPHAIISLAFSPSGRLLALGRSNGNVELWAVGANPPHAQSGASNGGANGWVLLKTVPGSGEPTVQVLLWAKGSGRGAASERLFSAGLNGRLIEWDLQLLAPKFASDTYGGAVWSGAIHATKVEGATALTIALGCEDGTVRLFDVSDASQGPLYSKALSRHSSRVLSVCWSPDGNLIASGGSDGMIKLWDLLNDGRNIQRITVENKGLRRTTLAEGNAGAPNKARKNGKQQGDKYDTYVWALVFLSGATLLSGDSLGNIQVWELEFGTLRQSFPKALQGDVLCVALNKQRNVLYASGVEGKIVELKRVSMDKEGASGDEEAAAGGDDANAKWLLTANHRQHTHDVYALAISPNTLPAAASKQMGSPKLGAVTAPLPNNYLLVSGGVDTQLLLSPTTCFPDYSSLTRLMPFPQNHGGVCVADKVMGPAPTAAINAASDDEEEQEEEEDAAQSGASTKLPARFLISHDQHLQLYSLGSYAYDQTAAKLRNKEMHPKEHDTLPLDKAYTHLLDINVNSRKSVDTSNPSASIWVPGGGLNLLCSAMSGDSRYIACSDPIQVKLYRVQHKRGSTNPNLLSVTKIKINHLVNPANSLTFSPDSTRLFVATLAGPVQILDLASLGKGADADDADEDKVVQTLDEHVPAAVYEGDVSSSDDDEEEQTQKKKKGKVGRHSSTIRLGVLRHMSVSSDQQYLCVCDEFNHAWVYNLDSMRLHATLPVFATPVLCMEFNPAAAHANELAVLCARNALYIYDVEGQKLTDYSKQNLAALVGGASASASMASAVQVSGGNLLSPASHLLSREQFTHLSFDRSTLSNSNSLLLHSLNLMCHINLDRPRPAAGPMQLLTGAQAQAAQSSSHLNRRDRKRKADDEHTDASAAAAVAASLPSDPRQVNFRVVTRFKPLLFCGFIDESDGLTAYKPAANVAAGANSADAKKKRKKEAADDVSNGAEETAATNGDFGVDPNADRPVVVGSSMLVIESPWVNILQQLPQPMARHRYGT